MYNKNVTLFEAYKKPSQAKINAWNDIQDEMLYEGGYGLHIVSHNTCFFTCAYYIDTMIGTIKVTHTPTKVTRKFIEK